MSELPWLHSLVKHNVATKHGSSKLLTSNELWLELQIKSTCILASIPDATITWVKIHHHDKNVMPRQLSRELN